MAVALMPIVHRNTVGTSIKSRNSESFLETNITFGNYATE